MTVELRKSSINRTTIEQESLNVRKGVFLKVLDEYYADLTKAAAAVRKSQDAVARVQGRLERLDPKRGL